MRITVIGSGAMGGLFSSLLSLNNEVTVIDRNEALIEKITKNGFSITDKDGIKTIYHPKAVESSKGLPVQDLVILFVKSMFNSVALEQNKNLIGEHTFLLSLQNGMGHEKLLSNYADANHVILGTTQHNAAIVGLAQNVHKGTGPTTICNLSLNITPCQPIADILTQAGFVTTVSSDVRRMIWNKLFTNVSASALTAILQVRLGYITSDSSAYQLCKNLIHETILVAKSDGFDFDFEEKVKEVTDICNNTPDGVTSISYDIKNNKKTEVDTISGSVLALAKEHGIETPYTYFIVTLIHAMEGRKETL
jgi:2-dehydropantoate 2-reductase